MYFFGVDGESSQGWSTNRSKMALGGGEFKTGLSVVTGSETMSGIVMSRGK